MIPLKMSALSQEKIAEVTVSQEEYWIESMRLQPEFSGLWHGPAWSWVDPLYLSHHRPEGNSVGPETECKLQYSDNGIFGIFKVQDKYIRCRHNTFQSDVYKDSCVEIFIQPKPVYGYFNFEFNCGGTLLATYITDSTRVDGKIKYFNPLSNEANQKIIRYHSLPERIEPELSVPTTWFLEFFIPFELMEAFVGELGVHETWRLNLYKCGDETSNPHWISWAPLDALNFHAPHNFREVQFRKDATSS